MAISLLRAEWDKKFDPAHIRPSGILLCMRQQYLQIQHALDPACCLPTNPDGMKSEAFMGTAARGNAYEKGIFEPSQKLKWGDRVSFQEDLVFPSLQNPDGTPVTAHPDGVVSHTADESGWDLECKTAFLKALPYLPRESHVAQQLLRLYIRYKYMDLIYNGEMTYYFAETTWNPVTGVPVIFTLEAETNNGFEGYWLYNEDKKPIWFFEKAYLQSLEDRIISLRQAIDDKEMPARESEEMHGFPCRTKTSLLDVECPWRGMCWEQEMQKYYDPGTSVRLGDLARNYKTVKDRQRELSNEQKLARMEASSIEKEFDNFFEFLGTEKITSDGLTISRSIIKIPPRLQDGYTYSRYTVRE